MKLATSNCALWDKRVKQYVSVRMSTTSVDAAPFCVSTLLLAAEKDGKTWASTLAQRGFVGKSFNDMMQFLVAESHLSHSGGTLSGSVACQQVYDLVRHVTPDLSAAGRMRTFMRTLRC
jgi:hypothetical protein